MSERVRLHIQLPVRPLFFHILKTDEAFTSPSVWIFAHLSKVCFKTVPSSGIDNNCEAKLNDLVFHRAVPSIGIKYTHIEKEVDDVLLEIAAHRQEIVWYVPEVDCEV